MSDTPKTDGLWSRAGAIVVTLDAPVVLRRECAQIERELGAECDALRAKNAALQFQVNALMSERIAEILLGICMVGFVGLLIWSLI